MASADLKIEGGELVLPEDVVEGNIYIENQKIAGIEKGFYGGARGKRTINAKGKVVLPGLVDIHVHMRDPGFTEKEDFETGTKAAAAGGVTTICDMPNGIPPVTSGDILLEKVEKVSPKALVDFCLYASASGIKEVSNFQRIGAVGLKLYMEKPSSKGSPYMSELTIIDDNELWDVFGCAAEKGMHVAVHLDTPSITEKLRENLRSKGQAWNDYYIIQNSIACEIAFEKLLVMAERSGARLHISHVPSCPCLNRVRDAKIRGIKFTADCVVPVIDLQFMTKIGPYGTPFGRPNVENESFWEALRDSVLDCIITDHAPHTINDKERGWKDIWSAPPGTPGLETLLGHLLTRVNKGLLSLPQVAEISSKRPAEIVGISKRKGSIEIGKEADLVLVNMKKEWIVENKDLHTKCGWSPFHGVRLFGQPVMTILRGNVIVEEGRIVGSVNKGRFIKLGTED